MGKKDYLGIKMLSKEELKKLNEYLRIKEARQKLLERNPEMKIYDEKMAYYSKKYHETKDKTFLYMFSDAMYQLSRLGYFGKMSAIEGDKAGQCFWEMIEKKSYELLIECIDNYPDKLQNIRSEYQKIIRDIIKRKIKLLLNDTKHEEWSTLYDALNAKFESLTYINMHPRKEADNPAAPC